MAEKGFSSSKLIEAIRDGSINRVINALDDGIDIEEADMHGQRGLPLRTACFLGNLSIVSELIRRGADVNATGADGVGMPLRLALRAGHKAVVNQLLKHGAMIPADVRIGAQFLAEVDSLDLPPLELEVPHLPPSIGTDSETIRIIEETQPKTDSIGSETRLLAMDLLRFNDDEDNQVAAPSRAKTVEERAHEKTQPDFWISGKKLS